jgi:hypothetical protein
MRHWLMLIIVLPLAACAVVEREPVSAPGLVIEPTVGIYSKSEIDAINAEAECKRMARNLVQIARCGTRR